MSGRRVLFFGSFDLEQGYPRARSLIQALETAGVDVSILNRPLFPTKRARLRLASQPLRWPMAALRVWYGGWLLRRRLKAMLKRQQIDAIIVPYPGHFAVRWARKVYDGPILLDLFLSLADTIISDRQMFRENGLASRLFHAVDRMACAKADLVFLDTPEHAAFAAELTGLPEEKFTFVPIGDPDAPPDAFEYPELVESEPLRVLYFGTGVPLHGVRTLLTACAKTPGVHLTFVGGTPRQREEARAISPEKVTVVDGWVGKKTMHRLYASHHVILGIFGTSSKAGRVVPFKILHSLSCGRPAVTADTSAVNTLLEPGWDCLTCPPGNSAALSLTLRSLSESKHILPRLASQARRSYERMFSPEAIGRRMLTLLEWATEQQWWPEEDQELCATGDLELASEEPVGADSSMP